MFGILHVCVKYLCLGLGFKRYEALIAHKHLCCWTALQWNNAFSGSEMTDVSAVGKTCKDYYRSFGVVV